jgi:hypothetical protein
MLASLDLLKCIVRTSLLLTEYREGDFCAMGKRRLFPIAPISAHFLQKTIGLLSY